MVRTGAVEPAVDVPPDLSARRVSVPSIPAVSLAATASNAVRMAVAVCAVIVRQRICAAMACATARLRLGTIKNRCREDVRERPSLPREHFLEGS